ncbi:succinate dehydrogenase cytochrome b subunit [Bdellovibrionota bacterium FG-2]
MISLGKALSSSVGKKFIMALSGLCLGGFIVVHLLGNLALYRADGTSFNHYAATLESFGKFIIAAEFGLIALFLIHAISAMSLKLNHWSARPKAYSVMKSKGGESKSSIASRNMIISGAVILVFVIWHVWSFKYGPGINEGYTVVGSEINGAQIRDLHRLVVESFHNSLVVSGYIFVMLLLGAHLWHAFWSALQSLGLTNPRYTKGLYCLGSTLAVVLSVGFLMIPIWIFFDLSTVLLGVITSGAIK